MAFVQFFDNYLRKYPDEFLFCRDKRAVRVFSVERGQRVFDTTGMTHTSFRAPEAGYQVEFMVVGIKCFLTEDNYQQSGLDKNATEFCGYLQLREQVVLGRKVIPVGHYIVCDMPKEDDLRNPTAYSADQFSARFTPLALNDLNRILQRFAPRPKF